MRIVLMGPPGAGKGTQAKRLADRFKMAHLSSGDILRAEKASGSSLGRQMAAYMDAGKLVPDEIVVSAMAKAVAQNASAGLLLDGFPRTLEQARQLDEQLAKAAAPLDGVVLITADADQIVQRITGRRSCPKCGKIYHMTYMPPKNDETCDLDGDKLIQRSDDREEVVRQRLEAYSRQTEPVIGYYRSRQDLPIVEVDGNAAPDEVTEDLVKGLQGLPAMA